MMKYDAIIIGSGLGGLTAGAFLANAGRQVLVLEKSDALGGRCRSVELMGYRFDIGADYFGRAMLKSFEELGKAGGISPVGFNSVSLVDGKRFTAPPGLSALGELGGFDMSLTQIGRFGFRMGKELIFKSYSKQIQNHLDLTHRLTRNPRLREVLNIGAFFSGNEPDNMPSYWFNLIFGRTYGYHKPFYPKGGSGRLAELLAEVICENGGGIVYNSHVKKITTENGAVSGVEIDGRKLESDRVICGTGILNTVHSLVGKELFPFEYLNTLSYYREGLTLASLFVVFKRTAAIKKGTLVYASFNNNISGMFRTLREGRFPDRSMFILSCPDGVADSGKEHYAGTIKFLVPKGMKDHGLIEAEARRIIRLADEVVPGFSESIVDTQMFAPRDYMEKFGFISSVSPVAESIHYQKFGHMTPVRNLHCVGSTVLPVGGCTVSAVESGRQCAMDILKGTVAVAED